MQLSIVIQRVWLKLQVISHGGWLFMHAERKGRINRIAHPVDNTAIGLTIHHSLAST